MCDSNPTATGRWAWLKRILPTNWRAIVAWAITLLFVYIGNCIRQHNGDISCGNRLEGGAYFTIFLPAAAPSASSASPPLFLATEDAR